MRTYLYRLILLNNPDVLIYDLVEGIVQVMRCSYAQAQKWAKEAKEEGSAVLCETYRERVEFLFERFKSEIIPVNTVFSPVREMVA